MRLRSALVLTAWLSAAGCAGPASAPPQAAASRPPNIVFIVVDDMRWDEFRAAGHPFLETSNMDRLAREGIRFTNAFATTPLCSPSRASLLTGQYARTHGIIDNTARPSHDLPIFPLELQRAGYTTGFFGKWHMGNDDSPRPGFNHWVAMPGQGESLDPHLNVDGERLQAKGYVTDVLTDYVERFIQRAGDKPFLAYLAHKAIHGPFTPAERHKEMYAGETRDTALTLPDSVHLTAGQAYLWWVQARLNDQSTVTAVTQRLVVTPK